MPENYVSVQVTTGGDPTLSRVLLTAEPVKAGQIVRKLLDGRLVFRPDLEQRLYTLEGRTTYGRLLAGTVLQDAWYRRGGLFGIGQDDWTVPIDLTIKAGGCRTE